MTTVKIPELSLVVLIGASGSGKSTFANRHFRPTEVLSSDFCRGLVSDDENDQTVTSDAFDVLRFIAGKRLAASRLTVIDATNVQPESRRPLLAANRGIDAFSHAQGSRPVVILGSDKGDAARSRFDAAHELGHLVCHPDADPGGEQEQQAHAFAAELLMPPTHFQRILPRRFDLGAYVRLKQEWGVSIAALLYRAKTLDVISDAAYRRAVMIMNKQYGRKNEPYPLERAELPALLATACQVAERSGVGREQIASEACLPLEDLDAIVGDPDPRPLVTV